MSSLKYLKKNASENKQMKKDNWKQILISILVGAIVTFLSTLFEGLAEALKAHSTEILAAVTSAGIYLAKAYKA